MGKARMFYGPLVEIEGGTIRWGNRTCFISSISQIWLGKPYEGKWGLAKDIESEGVNLELRSGSVQSFVSVDHEFLERAYELLCKIVSEGVCEEKTIIDFDKNLLPTTEEPEEEKVLMSQPVPIHSVNPNIRQELNILREHYKGKDTASAAITQIMDEISSCYDGNSNKDLRELYKLFLQLSLINDCNELGLNELIEEVRASVYHA